MKMLVRMKWTLAFLILMMVTTGLMAQNYEIKHEVMNASGWFGGDDRPSFGPRHVGVGQSVLIDKDMLVQNFSFYFVGPFDFTENPQGTGREVTLTLNVRESNGTIVKTLQTVVPASFTEGWVTWNGIDLDVQAGTSLIFTTYLVGAYDSLQVAASHRSDKDAGYANGVRYTKIGTSDESMEEWNGWEEHPWDSVFRLSGTLRTVEEARYNTINAYGWFGGDNRPSFTPRHIGVGQSVLIPTSMTLTRFSFYFRGPFDFASNPTGKGHAVTLTLNVRDEAGNILKTVKTTLNKAFQEGWVTWTGIDLDVSADTKLIFTTYLNGAYDSLQVNASQAADADAGYTDGVRYTKNGNSDSDMEDWTGWSPHPWDSVFWLAGYSGTTPVEIIHAPTPESFTLHQNYPNPFNPETRIQFDLKATAKVELAIYDLTGKRVRTLISETMSAGRYSVSWDGRNEQGKLMPSGIYFYRLKTGDQIQTRRMVFLQ